MSAAAFGTAVVTLDQAGKSFGAVRALHAVSLTISAGECLALVGHNGAGKSTLVNLINGALTPSEGSVSYHLPNGATGHGSAGRRSAGVRAVHQELSLCPNLTLAENLRVPQRDLVGFGWRKQARARIGAALDAVFPGHTLHPDRVAGDLSLAERQMAEIAMGFSNGPERPRLVILDEPTSSLDAAIAAQLMRYVQQFCAEGGAVIFISHMMGEVFDVASRIVVMKDGSVIADRPAREFTRASLVAAMGDMTHEAGGRRPRPEGPEILRSKAGLSARKGEIVGLAGLAGHGQTEALTDYYLSATSDWHQAEPPLASFVAGDRSRDGVFPLWSIQMNASLAKLPALLKGGLIKVRDELALGQEWQKRIGIRTGNLENPILSLSGGNQQKVLFARALATAAQVIVMDDPMRGVDVGTKAQVYDMIRAEADAGLTFLWYSTESDEVELCDRVFVFRNHQIVAELVGDEITEEALLAHSFEIAETA